MAYLLGLGSAFLWRTRFLLGAHLTLLISTNRVSNLDCNTDKTASVQRSQSMKYPSSIPQNDLSRKRRLSYHKLTHPSLHASSQSSYERVDTPSSGYCGSQSGTCSMQSSLYSLGSVDIPEAVPNYKCSSLKRNSTITAIGTKGKECKKSARSYSFNDKYTINHDL